jgi:hypothetical protein
MSINHDAERYDHPLLYTSPAPASSQGIPNHTASPVLDSAWHSSHQQSPIAASSLTHSPQVYPSVNRSGDDINYASPSDSASCIPSNPPDNYTAQNQSQPPDHDMFTQMEGSIGPSRVQTRRQRAMAGVRPGVRRESTSSHSNTPTGGQDTSEVRIYSCHAYEVNPDFISESETTAL